MSGIVTWERTIKFQPTMDDSTKPITVTVSGAAGQIGYALVPLICNGELLPRYSRSPKPLVAPSARRLLLRQWICRRSGVPSQRPPPLPPPLPHCDSLTGTHQAWWFDHPDLSTGSTPPRGALVRARDEEIYTLALGIGGPWQRCPESCPPIRTVRRCCYLNAFARLGTRTLRGRNVCVCVVVVVCWGE